MHYKLKESIIKKFIVQDGDSAEAEGAELIDKNTDSNMENTQTRIKLPNPFRKSKIEEDGKDNTFH